MESEQELLKRARALEEGALAAIFDQYYEAIYRYIYHYTGHVQTAEDMTAEVFQRLLEQLHAGRGPDFYIKAWLYRVAHNVIIDEMRRLPHRDHRQLDEELAAPLASPEEQTQEAILSEQARRALLRLTSKQRSVIVMRFLEGMEHEEIAQVLSLPVGAVKALQHRALASMRRSLAHLAG